MTLSFIYVILTLWVIYYLLGTGQKFFITLKWTIDFSYLGIVIFWAYSAVLLSNQRGWNMLAAMGGAFVLSLLFTWLVLYLSGRLDEAYFAIGTLALYMLSYQLAINLEPVTGGTFGLSVGRELFSIQALSSNLWFLIFAWIIWVVLLLLLFYFKQTYFYKVLEWRGEREVVISSLWVKTSLYKLVLIVLTTLIAVIGGWLLSFYLRFIDPWSFWLSLLILTMSVAFLAYGSNEFGTLLIAILLLWSYEFLRFFKVVDTANIGYFREMVFAVLVMIASYWIFKRQKFWRRH